MSGQSVHSDHGASSAYRWMPCPGSIREIKAARERGDIDERSTEFSAQGTAAHELGEFCLRKHTDAVDHLGRVIHVDDFSFEVDEDMAEAVQVYLETVRGDMRPGCDLYIEERFHLTTLDDRFYGTNDAMIYDPAKKLLRVYDYKHGRGVGVNVVDNKQLKYYALGAMHKIDGPIVDVELIIVQPRFVGGEPVQRWMTTFVDLVEYGGELIMAAEATDAPDAPLVPDLETDGDHCRFCPVAGICKARAEAVYASVGAAFSEDGDMTLDDPQSVGENFMPLLLERAQRIEDWIKAVKQHAHVMAEQGRPPAGWKLVNKRGQRKWMLDDDALVEALRAQGCNDDQIFVKKLASPAQVEKAMGKKEFALLNAQCDLAEQVSTGTVLAPESDKRPAVEPRNSIENAFD